jgi:SAM-dependent methyltransferase
MASCNHSGVTSDTPRPRWFDVRTPRQRAEYAERFLQIAAAGDDVDGEARFVDALAGRDSRVLDAGCGTGRVAAALAARGHAAVGVDADPVLVERGREQHPGLPLAVLDLCHATPGLLAEQMLPPSYDVVVCAGNVLHFVAPGTEARVVAALAALLRPGGRIAFGLATGRPYGPDSVERDAVAAGLEREHRFADWELRPWHEDSDWAVCVLRRPS